MNKNFEVFKTFLKNSESLAFYTIVERAKFTYSYRPPNIFYIPESTKKENKNSLTTIKKVFDHYVQTVSFDKSDYNHITRKSSYSLSLIKAFFEMDVGI